MLVRQLANHLRLAWSLSAKDYKPHYIPICEWCYFAKYWYVVKLF